MRAFLFSLAVLCVAAPTFAQTPEHLAAVDRAAAVGQELYEHDQAAWHGTDAMLADIRDPRSEGLSGWITERTPEGLQVLFLKPEGERVTAVYRALLSRRRNPRTRPHRPAAHRHASAHQPRCPHRHRSAAAAAMCAALQ